MEILFVLIVVLLLAVHIAVQLAAAQEVTFHSPLSPDAVHAQVPGAFIARLHEIRRSGARTTIRPRYKRHAPTFSVETDPAPGGSVVTIAMEEWTSISRRFGRRGGLSIPLGRAHAFWVLRKRRTISARLQTAPAEGVVAT